jgi:hypothetical protein
MKWRPWCKVIGEIVDGGERWICEYEVVRGKLQRMKLDATSEGDAIFEAEGLTEITTIQVEWQ